MKLRHYLALALAIAVGVVAGGLALQAAGVIGDSDDPVTVEIREDPCADVPPWDPAC